LRLSTLAAVSATHAMNCDSPALPDMRDPNVSVAYARRDHADALLAGEKAAAMMAVASACCRGVGGKTCAAAAASTAARDRPRRDAISRRTARRGRTRGDGVVTRV
jgi:hypothetical protein